LRSILPNPFADGGQGEKPNSAAGRAARAGVDRAPDAGKGESLDVAIATAKPKAQGRDAIGGREDRVTGAPAVRKDDSAAGQGRQGRDAHADPFEPQAGDAQADPFDQKPLPTKEESLREIREEAERKKAEGIAKFTARAEANRLERQQERIRFRQELREALRLPGSAAGPEIDKLAHRYGYDIDMDQYSRADRFWHFRRTSLSLKAKVQFIRSLDLPESVILDFLSNDLHKAIKTRNGPRNDNEVRVRAAWMLLSCDLPGDVPASRSTGGAEPGGAASPAPARSATDAPAPNQ
jgi:hypothetical protein